jgi:Tol biopolymer transport system component
MRRLAVVVLLGIAFASAIMLLTSATQPAIADPGTTERVSVDSAGGQGNSFSANEPAISADGRFIAFEAGATNLVVDDTNGARDIFVHDRQTGITERVSVDSAGNEGNNDSGGGAITADGRYVAFGSGASNLIPDDTNDASDIFVHDRQTGITERVSVDSAGSEANAGSGGGSRSTAISADGRFIAFESGATNLISDDTNSASDIFVHDRQTGITERVSVDSAGNEGNHDSEWFDISADGRFVAFQSYASNLVPDDTNGNYDIFVHDLGELPQPTPTPTPSPTPPPAVGGIVEIRSDPSAPAAQQPGSAAPPHVALAAAAAAGALALTAAAWYARRRSLW